MKNDKDIIDYIKANNQSYSDKDLDNCSITTLIIIKTEIEVRLHFSKKKK